jgi:hypothetical protein
MDEMQREHPVELLYLERAAAQINNTKWPRFISLAPEEQPAPEPQPEPEIETPIATEPEQNLVAGKAADASTVETAIDLTEAAPAADTSEEGQSA